MPTTIASPSSIRKSGARACPLGFIPTGWYPTSVRFAGGKIVVANGKGMSSLPNPQGPSPLQKEADEKAAQYIGALYLGHLERDCPAFGDGVGGVFQAGL